MSKIISLVQVRHSRAKRELEELTRRLKEDISQLERKPITFCENSYDSEGRTYRGTRLKDDVFFERAYLESIGIQDVKVYPAHNKDGTLNSTHFALYGRD